MAVGEDAFSVPVCFRRRARDSAPYLQPARGRARCPYRAASPFKTVGFCLLFLLAAALCSTALAADKKIVLIAGSRSHGSGEHEFRAACLLLQKWLNKIPGVTTAVYFDGWPDRAD